LDIALQADGKIMEDNLLGTMEMERCLIKSFDCMSMAAMTTTFNGTNAGADNYVSSLGLQADGRYSLAGLLVTTMEMDQYLADSFVDYMPMADVTPMEPMQGSVPPFLAWVYRRKNTYWRTIYWVQWNFTIPAGSLD
jgi:hypothetical protein